MLDALLGELDFRALLIMLDATCNVMPRVSLGQAAATVLGLAFIGTFLLGIEDAHYRLVLTSTAPDAAETEDMQCLQERLNQSVVLKDRHNQRHNRHNRHNRRNRRQRWRWTWRWQDKRSLWCSGH